MFEVPGSEIKSVHITEECVLGSQQPIYIRHSNTSASSDPSEQSTSSEEEENRKFRVKQ